MKKTSLVLSTLLILFAGCTSELDRCIETNAKKLAVTPIQPEQRSHISDICKERKGKFEESVVQCIKRETKDLYERLKKLLGRLLQKSCHEQGIY
jgi:hypothetical protein